MTNIGIVQNCNIRNLGPLYYEGVILFSYCTKNSCILNKLKTKRISNLYIVRILLFSPVFLLCTKKQTLALDKGARIVIFFTLLSCTLLISSRPTLAPPLYKY